MKFYKSWIPNVSGYLSFSNIKGVKIPGRAEHAQTCNQLSDDAMGCIHSLQKRNLSDTIYSAFDRDGMFWYVLSANVQNINEEELLAGKIYTYPLESLSPEDKLLIEAFEKAADQKAVADKLIAVRETCSATRVVEFKLYRDGIIELFCDESYSKNTDDFMLEAYSFLKDLVHSHKFHSYDDDAIIVPYPVKSPSDTDWSNRTVKNLHKSIVSTYRNRAYKADIINAIGRLSYLESFLNILSRKKNANFQGGINTAALRTSLETKLSSAELDGNGKAIFLQVYVPIFLAVIALLIGMTQLLQLPCINGLTFSDGTCTHGGFNLPESAYKFAQFGLENWYNLIVVLPLGTVGIIFYVQWHTFYRWLNHNISHGYIGWIQRLAMSIASSTKFGRIWASVLIAIVIALLLYMTYLIIGPMFEKR